VLFCSASLDRAKVLGKHGGDRNVPHDKSGRFVSLKEAIGKPKPQGANSTLKRGSTSRAYILARLERDGQAKLAAKVCSRKMSARGAATRTRHNEATTTSFYIRTCDISTSFPLPVPCRP
jgi:hypothetical protein